MSRRTLQPRRTSARGFTLLELIFVLLLIAVAVAIVVPSLSGTAKGRRVGDTAAQLVTLTNYAHDQAIAEGRLYRLNFDPSGTSYGLTAQQDDGTFGNLGKEIGQQFAVPDDVKVETDLARQQDGGIYITFRPSGRCDPAPVNIRVSDRTGGVTQITCESPTELFHIVDAPANGHR